MSLSLSPAIARVTGLSSAIKTNGRVHQHLLQKKLSSLCALIYQVHGKLLHTRVEDAHAQAALFR